MVRFCKDLQIGEEAKGDFVFFYQNEVSLNVSSHSHVGMMCKHVEEAVILITSICQCRYFIQL